MNNELVKAPAVASINNLVWPYEDIKKAIEIRLKSYEGLQVDADNLEAMKRNLNDVKQYRIAISKFAQDQKRELKKPYDRFSAEVKDVLLAVDMVETPLKQQIDVFNEREKQDREAEFREHISNTALTIGLREEYLVHLVFDDSWLNKSAKKKDVLSAISYQLNELKQRKNNDDDYKKIMLERREMLEMYVDMFNANYGLETQLNTDGVLRKVEGDTLDVAKEKIKVMFEDALARELVEKEAIERAERALAETAQENNSNTLIDSGNLSGEALEHIDAIIYITEIEKGRLEALKAFLDKSNISYTVEWSTIREDEVRF